MRIESSLFQRWTMLLMLVLPVAAAAGGCNRKSAAQVRGHVFYKDGTVPKGGLAVVHFSPTDSSTATIRKGASGAIEPDGSFVMVTRKPGDGVYLGTYNVSFAVLRNGLDRSSSLIEPKYTNPASSGYTVEVDGDKNDLKFEIERLPGAATTAAPASDRKGPGT